MRTLAILVLISILQAAHSGPFGMFRRGSSGPVNTTANAARGAVQGAFSNAQGVAEYMARTGRIGHFGGNSGFEGVGMGATAAQAIANTCKPRSGGYPRETGVSQGANGMFYACNRW